MRIIHDSLVPALNYYRLLDAFRHGYVEMIARRYKELTSIYLKNFLFFFTDKCVKI